MRIPVVAADVPQSPHQRRKPAIVDRPVLGDARARTRLELLERKPSGRLGKVTPDIVFRSPVPRAALQRFTLQMLKKAAAAIEAQPWGQRYGGTETFAVAKADLPEAARHSAPGLLAPSQDENLSRTCADLRTLKN